MQNNEMVEKKKALFDREEIPGLVSVDEISEEKRSVEVPGFNKIRDVQSDITKLPQLVLKYKLENNTNTKQFFDDYFDKNETKDITIIRTDAHGVEFDRITWTQCEALTRTTPAYDAANPEYASVTMTFAPYDKIPV